MFSRHKGKLEFMGRCSLLDNEFTCFDAKHHTMADEWTDIHTTLCINMWHVSSAVKCYSIFIIFCVLLFGIYRYQTWSNVSEYRNIKQTQTNS